MPLLYDIHVYPNPIIHASRIKKFVQTVSKINNYEILIIGTYEKLQAPIEYISNNIRIKRIRLFSGLPTSITLLKIFKAIEFNLQVLFSCLFKNIRIINIHTLSTLPVGIILKFIKKAGLIYNIHELETEKLGWKGYRQILAKCFERMVIPFADQVIVVSSGIAKWYEDTYGIRVTTVLNTVCTQKQTGDWNSIHNRFHLPSNSTIFVYVGSLSAGRGIDLLLEVFQTNKFIKPNYSLYWLW